MPSPRIRSALLALGAVGAAHVAVPAAADASILVQAVPSSLKCGRSIVVGTWNRPDGRTISTKRVRIVLRSARGKTIASRTVTARGSWRYLRYKPRCGRTYRVSYSHPQFGTQRYRVKVRR